MIALRNPKMLVVLLIALGAGLAAFVIWGAVNNGSVAQAVNTNSIADERASSAVPWPAARIQPGMVYDPAMERMLMFGGMALPAETLNDVWSYQALGGSWALLGDMALEEPLVSFGFDAESARVVALTAQQTWTYDLASGVWAPQESDGSSLPQASGADVAYDAESDRLILFGGGGASDQFNDETWAYDYNSNTWTKLNPSSSPAPRAMHRMAYDSESDRVILWGGRMETGTEDRRIWAYDFNRNTWESFDNIDGPPGQWDHYGMAYIPTLDRILVFSGMREDEGVLAEAQTWYYDYNSNTWSRIETEISPPAMAMYAMAYDPSIEQVIVFGGELNTENAGEMTNDLWFFDPVSTHWRRATAAAARQSFEDYIPECNCDPSATAVPTSAA